MQLHMEQLLRLISQRNRQIVQIKSIALEEELVSVGNNKNLLPELKIIYDHFFNDNKNTIEIQKVMPFQIKTTKVPVCNKVFRPAQSIYRCYDCFIHEAAVLCQSCFQNGNHSGHRFKKLQTTGGNCDCGNPLALKKQGFCVNHTGKVEVPIIPQNQEALFKTIIQNMFKWFFQLQSRKKNTGFYYLSSLIKFLIKLNKESIYYNVLTFHFLIKKTKKTNCYIDEIFKIQNQQLCRIFNQLFFMMFSLDEFKVILADKFITAYNQVVNFEKTPFHSLFIQLFANDYVVLDVVLKFNNMIHVQKKDYDFEGYLQDINFINTISEQAANVFYKSYFEKNKNIPFPILDEIETDLQQKGILHLVDLVSKDMKQQNFYYYVHTQLYKKNKDNKEIITILQGIFQKMNSKQHSYIKNRAILPFHRMFALGLFTLFKGSNKDLSLQKIATSLKVDQTSLLKFYKKALNQVLNCLTDFAETYARRNYFDNYVVLYVRSGVSCGLFDQLFIKQTAIIFSKLKLSFEQLLLQKLNEKAKDIIQNKIDSTWNQGLLTWIYLCQLLLEIGVTSTAQIILNQKIQINNKQLIKKKIVLFKSLLKKIGSASRQQLQVLERYFVEKLDDNFLFENSQLNKTTKKYSIKQKQTQFLPFFYNIFISKRKSGQMLLVQSELSQVYLEQLKNSYSNEEDQIILQTIAPKTILKMLAEFVVKSIQQKGLTSKQQESTLNTFSSMINKFQIYQRQKDKYGDIQQKLRSYFPKKQQQNTQLNEQVQKLRIQKLKKRQSQKKAKFMDKQTNILKSYTQKLKQELKQQNQQSLTCLKCKDEKKNNQSLCYFANLKYKTVMSAKMSKNKFSFLYTSCFHLIHLSCFKELCQDGFRAYCPLCKSQSNIVIPVQSKYSLQTFNQSKRRIQGVMKKLKINQQQEESQSKKPYLLKSLIDCLIQYIGFAGVINDKQFQKKLLRICKQLVSLLNMFYNTFDIESKELTKKNLLLQLESSNNININEEELKEEEKNKKAVEVFGNVKKIILQILVTVVMEDKQVQLSKLAKKYNNLIYYKDLAKIIRNNELVFSNNLSTQQNFQIQQNNLSSLSSYFSFYKPPELMKQVIAERDSKFIVSCKAGHNVCFCCECKQIVCEDCKTLYSHCRLHGSQSMYFSLLAGSLIIFTPRQFNSQSLYENKFGTSWTPDYDPEGFTLNEQLYNNFVINLSFHTINDFIQKQKSKISSINIIFE